MRSAEFWELMNAAFGAAYAGSLARDQALSAMGSRTIMEALEAGESAKDVWRVVVEQFELPARFR